MFKRMSKIRTLWHSTPFQWSRRNFLNRNGSFIISDEVASSLMQKSPVVALESTIITHGMPHPQNLRTALEVEGIVRQNKAVPATIGVINGKIHIGMTEKQIEFLATKDEKFVKISRRDLPFAISKNLCGGTTVAATMVCAHMAGIRVFVTGGVGGVHRGADKSMDISADLNELGRTPVTVVSAGVKSILDIGLTLEYLETQGVCVATYGKSREFPAFFTSRSGLDSPYTIENAKDAARLIEARDALSLNNGILIAVPIPSSAATQSAEIEEAIEKALNEAKVQNVAGKEVTPFVLAKVQELSAGASLEANIALIRNNAHVGSLIAVELAKMSPHDSGNAKCNEETSKRRSSKDRSSTTVVSPSVSSRPVVIGGTNLDLNITCLEEELKIDGSTQVGKIEVSAGGVGRNIADCLARIGADPLFISTVGGDENGSTVLQKMLHMDTSGIHVNPDIRTASCAVMLDRNGDCAFIIGDMNAHDHINSEMLKWHKDALLAAPIVVMDGNIPVKTMEDVISICSTNQVPIWFEPTDVNKAGQLSKCSNFKDAILYTSPNMNELLVLYETMCHPPSAEARPFASAPGRANDVDDIIRRCLELSAPLMKNVTTLVVTLGPLGALLITKEPEEQLLDALKKNRRNRGNPEIRVVYYPPLKPSSIVSVSGAGDCFAAAMIGAMIRGLDQDSCIRVGMMAALSSMISHHAVPSSITPDLLSTTSLKDREFPEPKVLEFTDWSPRTEAS